VLLQLDRVGRSFAARRLFGEVTLDVRPGDRIALVGPNGAGKTTTLRCLSGIIPPTSGSILIAGCDIEKDRVEARRTLAFVPDEPFRDGSEVGVRSMAVDHVVLAVTRYEAERQQAGGQFVELSEEGGVRLRPWFIRYATTAQLDAMAVAAGLTLEHRWTDVAKAPFDADSDRHVSVYRSEAR